MTKRSLSLIFILAALLLAACSRAAAPNFAEIPVGKAFANGQEIFFSHTEVSDAGVAELLSGMMNSPVLHVPSLAEVPDSALADVYVFQNGPAGSGPLGFQADVFPSPPGEPGYTPLRKITFVNWVDESQASQLTSADQVLDLAAQGALTLERSDIVVNMPFMTWDGGQR